MGRLFNFAYRFFGQIRLCSMLNGKMLVVRADQERLRYVILRQVVLSSMIAETGGIRNFLRYDRSDESRVFVVERRSALLVIVGGLSLKVFFHLIMRLNNFYSNILL